jgi:hypothetical protein
VVYHAAPASGIAEAIEAYERRRWPDREVSGGKG